MKFEFMRNDFEKKNSSNQRRRRLEPTYLKDINFRISLILILCTLVNQFLFLICSSTLQKLIVPMHAYFILIRLLNKKEILIRPLV